MKVILKQDVKDGFHDAQEFIATVRSDEPPPEVPKGFTLAGDEYIDLVIPC